MKRKIGKRLLAWALCLVLFVGNSITAFATEDEQEVSEATSVLVDVEEAQAALKEIAEEREIPALLYLKDIYTVKTKPDKNSNDVVSIATGQEVLITGVDEDKGHNIWYQVTYNYDEGSYSGYVEREYLAFSDERLREWEDIHIRSMRMWSRRAAVSYADVEQFPDSYQDALYALKEQHPNWTFVKMETGLDWNYVVRLQSEGARSLISNKSAPDSWKDGYYSSSWAIASDGIIKYYLDPRNSLTEKSVFQFEQLTYNKSYHTVSSTQMVLEGTFMDDLVPQTDTYYSEAFMNIAAEKNISPILMAARVRQEQGVNGSKMISGTYPGFEGLYNHYNIGASGNTKEKELASGLAKAREMGWTTPMLSLAGGSSVLSNNYIRKGQDTLYLQKFDVDSSYNGVCWHQYMQNIQAPTTEAASTYKAYNNAGILNFTFVFKVPVFRNMPSYACTQPGTQEKVTLNVSTVENLPVDSTAVLISYINGSQNTSVAMEYTSSNTDVATVDSNGVVTGIHPGETTITCKRVENAGSATTASCKVIVVKADISMDDVEIPEVEVTYSSKQKLSSIELPDGFAWVDGSVVPGVVNNGYSVTYNPDNSKYNTLTLTIPVTVNKAVTDKSALTVPSNLTAVAGDELKSVALPNGFIWDDALQKVPKKVGTYQYGASYCVDDMNYEVLEDITLSINVVCKTHEFGEWEGNHADCTHDGELIRRCVICGEKESVVENAVGHEYVSEITKEPSYFESGIRTYTCAKCDDTYQVEIPAVPGPHTHEYEEEITVEPTCELTGIRTFTCDCNDVYTQTIEALGHDMVDGECTRCEYVIPPLPQHTHSYTFSGSTETCTEDGLATYTCGCGESYTEETDALGHDVVDGKCTRCDYKVEAPEEDGDGSGDSGTGGEDNSGQGSNTGSDDNNDSGQDGNTGSGDSGAGGGDDSGQDGNGDSGNSGNPGDAGSDDKNTENNKDTESDKNTENDKNTEQNKDDEKSDDDNKSDDDKMESSSDKKEENKNILDVIQSILMPQNTNQNAQQGSNNSNASTADKTSDGLEDQNVDNAQTEENTIGQDTVEQTPNAVKITMRHSTMLDKDKLAIVSESSRNLELVMADDVKWKLNLSNVDDIKNINVDMAVTLYEADIPKEVLDTLPQDSPMILMSLSHEGPFEFEAVLEVPVNKLNAGKYANLFYYNPDTGEMEFIAASLVSADGTAEFKMEHASDYAIVMAENSMDPNPPAEEVDVPEEVENSADGKPIASMVLMVVLIVLISALAIVAIVFGVRFLKKKSEDIYYFDEEDEAPEEKIQ